MPGRRWGQVSILTKMIMAKVAFEHRFLRGTRVGLVTVFGKSIVFNLFYLINS